ncbi:MAG TPA: hypothetical protein DCL68_00255 [Gammaproteobacteria bacterium]|nr:hypothetical protein [Gammaproteobacteria bacterium]|tara:strand:- start:1881 stop:2414 length:534 start_codon:yes stop_codon:yes gene_type:complete
MLMKEIRTERLLIKTPEIDDKFELTQLINDKDVIKWLSEIPFPYTLNHAEEFIERSRERVLKQESYNFMIFQDKKMIGGIGLSEFNNKSCHVGYWLGKKYWGNGFATEALKSILDFGFDQLNLEKIYAAYKIGNEGSIRVLNKSGFEYSRKKYEYDSVLNEEVFLTEMILRKEELST